MMKGNKYVLEAELVVHSKRVHDNSEEDYMLAKRTKQNKIDPNTICSYICFSHSEETLPPNHKCNAMFVCTAPT